MWRDKRRVLLLRALLKMNSFIDFKETFSPGSTKDPFKTVMALIAYFDLELHHIDVKTTFFNGNIDEKFIWCN